MRHEHHTLDEPCDHVPMFEMSSFGGPGPEGDFQVSEPDLPNRRASEALCWACEFTVFLTR